MIQAAHNPAPNPQPRIMFARLSLAMLAMATASHGALTLQNADSLWKFDGGASGTATNAQIIDATGNHTAINANRLSWSTNVPALSPAGGQPVDSLGRALTFNPQVTAVNAGAGVADSVAAGTFQVANGTVSGEFSVLTRAMWAGPATMSDGTTFSDDTVTNQWLLNNGLGGNGQGFLMGILPSSDGNSARMAYYTSTSTGGPPTFTQGTRTYTTATSFSITKNVWYDIAMVVSTGDGDATTVADNSVTFYLYGPDGLVTASQSGMYISDISTIPTGTTLTVGSESAGTGTSNQRKSFNGSLDYLAMFEDALSQEEVVAIFAAPEPGRVLFLLFGLLGLVARRRR